MASGVRTLYNILFICGFVLASPYYYWRMRRRPNWKPGFNQRFARYDSKFKQAITNRQVLWMHGVSNGEVGLCTQLVRELEPRLPNMKLIVSTTTSTGMGILQSSLPSHVSRIYYPIDRRAYVSRALAVTRPEAVVLIEAEIWPNFLWRTREMGIPTFLVNARLSEGSYRNYKRFGFLFRPIFASFSGVGAQSEKDAERLIELGCRPEVVRVVGSLKFKVAELDELRLTNVGDILRRLGVPAGAPILVAGSTHDGEEAILARQFLRLRERHPNLFLILVPRHFERCKTVGRELDALGIKYIFRNEITPQSEHQTPVDCLLVNTMGELNHFYKYATVAFVGKSLTAEGGQNPIEPAALGKAVVFGPNMQNFPDIAPDFVNAGGAVQVRDAAELEATLDALLGDEARRQKMGEAAVKVVHEKLGAVERTVDMIVDSLDSEIYVAPKK